MRLTTSSIHSRKPAGAVLAMVCATAVACSSVTLDRAPAADSGAAAVPTGYTDTPMLPDSRWRVHDDERPRPAVVVPANTSGAPPADAIVLFDGRDLLEWRVSGTDAEANWLLEDNAMIVPPRTNAGPNHLVTRRQFGDVQMHIEWRTPDQVVSNSQGRGNSGVFFFEQYEIQVLDSYDNMSYADGEAAAIYGWMPPLANASRRPGVWQSYDIVFEAPRFSNDGELLTPAHATVFHNGVLVHMRQAFLGATAHKKLAKYQAHGPVGRILLQDHRNPVAYRNIWVRELDLAANK